MDGLFKSLAELCTGHSLWYAVLIVPLGVVCYALFKVFDGYWEKIGARLAERRKRKALPEAPSHADRAVAIGGDNQAPVTTGDRSPAFNQPGQAVAGDQLQAARDAIKATTYVAHVDTLTIGTVSTPPSSLHQLPPPPSDFTGRCDELASLRAAVASGKIAISGLKGMGGVGKTTLALKLAQDLLTVYPDAQIRVDMKGTASDPGERATPMKAMEHVIHSFDPNVKLPEDEDAVAGLYRSILFGRKALILADNAFDAPQVAPLAPPKGSLLLVTSRQSFEMSGWFAIDLDLLPLEDARALLIAICPRIGPRADALAGLCGRLPLALRLAGGALKAMDDLPVDDYIDGLKEARSKVAALDEYKYRTDVEKTIAAALRESYRLLTEDEARFWRTLSVFPASFFAFSAAAIAETDDKTTAGLLHRLDFFNLIDHDETAQRYHLHDLSRDFASSRLAESPDEAYAARMRHAAHYAVVLRSLDDLYLKRGDNVMKGLALFDLERANIDHGFKWSCANASDEADAAAICNGYCDTGYVLDLRQHPRTERIPWLEAALAAARKAIEYYEKALVIDKEMGDRRGEGYALYNMAIQLHKLGQRDEAIPLAESSLAILSAIESPHAPMVRATLAQWKSEPNP